MALFHWLLLILIAGLAVGLPGRRAGARGRTDERGEKIELGARCTERP